MPKQHRISDDGQIGLIGMVIALALVGLLSALAFGVFSGSGAPGGSSGSGSAVVGSANDVQAKTSLQTATQLGDEAGAGGNYGSLSASTLSSTGGAGVTFTSGASTSYGTVSVAASGPGTGGSATLAVLSASGTCWYAWLGTGGPFYGAQTNQTSCQAVTLTAVPTPGTTPSASAIGWLQGAFPPP